MRAWIISLVIFFVLYPSASWSEAQNEATEGGARNWGIAALTQQERFDGIQRNIKDHNFVVSRFSGFESDEQAQMECTDVLEKMKSVALSDILVPEKTYPFLKNFDPSVLGGCSDIDLDREYHPSKKIWLDPSNALSKYSYYFQATANLEIYDLSSFLGKGKKGAFVEGGSPQCKDQTNPDCKNMVGFQTLGKVFDIKKCQVHDLNMLGATRKTPIVTREKGNQKVNYKETKSFFAFISLGAKGLYHLIYKDGFHSGKLAMGKVSAQGNAGTRSCTYTRK